MGMLHLPDGKGLFRLLPSITSFTGTKVEAPQDICQDVPGTGSEGIAAVRFDFQAPGTAKEILPI